MYSDDQTGNYVKAIAVQLNPTQLQIIIQGDYIVDTSNFNLVNMRTGAVVNATLSNVLTLQDASYLGSFSAVDNKEKQITVLYDLASGKNNVVFASIDYNSDGTYNWVSIGNFVNGIDGRSIFGLTASTASGVFAVAKANDLLVSGEDFTYEGHDYKIGDLDLIDTLDPITLVSKGNIRGATGLQGIQGNPGADGANGLTPYIGSNGNWWIGDTDTTVRAEARDGVDGVDGQAFNIQSGLYSVPANVGNPNNLDPNGNTLTTLPTLPQTDISGKGYVVYDPITTPLEPYYDLYWANNGDTNWTIVHPFSGIKGQDGKDGYTPYIQNNVWYINGVSTGVQATGNTGATGATGATPNISVSATELPAGSAPTATRSGTDANPIITFGIPSPLQFKTIDLPITKQTTTTTLSSGVYFDQGYKYSRTYTLDVTNLINIIELTIFNYTFIVDDFLGNLYYINSDLTYGYFNYIFYNSLKGLQVSPGKNDTVSDVIIVPTSINTSSNTETGQIVVYSKLNNFNTYKSVRLNYLD